jgi:hypothetical protein
VLETEYLHALRLLAQADEWFDQSRSNWCIYQDAFCDTLVRRILRRLVAKRLPGGMADTTGGGKLITHGWLIKAGQAFDATYPIIANNLRSFHDRRSRVPAAHPYVERTGARGRYVTQIEQKALRSCLVTAFEDLGTLVRGIA